MMHTEEKRTEEKVPQEKSGFWRYLRMALYLCLLVFGVWGVIYSYQQPRIPSTVISVGPATSTTRRPRHGSSYTVYRRTLRVVYEENGEEKRAEVRVSYRNRWAPPREGMELEICRNPLGEIVAFPDLKTREIGLFAAVIGGVMLLAAGLIVRAGARKEQERFRTSGDVISPKREPEGTLPEGIREENGRYAWYGRAGDEYVREQSKRVAKIMGLVTLGILLVATLMTMGSGSWEFWLIMLGVAAAMMLIGLGVSRIMLRDPSLRRIYCELGEDGLRIGEGKSFIYLPWDRVLEVRDRGRYLEVAGKVRQVWIYPPEGGKAFVLDYIREHARCGVSEAENRGPRGEGNP